MTDKGHQSASYRPDIDGLRAVAVLCVIFFHLKVPGFQGGYVGVDVFFVISAYLITSLIKAEIESTGNLDFKAFYYRRLKRLFPAFFALCVTTALAAGLLLSPTGLSKFGGSLVASLACGSNVLFWFETDYFDIAATTKPLLHTWSLGIEEQFYLLWPPLLLWLLHSRRSGFAKALLLALGIGSLALNLLFESGVATPLLRHLPLVGGKLANIRPTTFFLLPFRIYEFVIGGLLAWEKTRQASPRFCFIHDALLLGGLGLIIWSTATFNHAPSYYALAPCLGTALAIIGGKKARWRGILSNRFSVRVGLLSYSLYLVHWPMCAFWTYLRGDFTPAAQAAIALSSVTLAVFCHRFIERPFRVGQLNLALPMLKYPALIGALLALGVGLSMHESGGWPWRLKPSVKLEFGTDAKNFHEKYYGGAGFPKYGPVHTTMPADIVLMGDSHARHYATGLYELLARPRDLALYIASGRSCLHLPGFTRTKGGQNYDRDCPTGFETALRYIRAAGPSPLVVVSHHWIAQTAQASLLEKGSARRAQARPEDVIAAILRLRDLIGESGSLIVIGQVPGTNYKNLHDLLTRPEWFNFLWTGFSASDDSTSRAEPERITFNNLLRHAAQESGKFLFLDPFEVLCAKGSYDSQFHACRNFDDGGNLLYSDHGHLSIRGSLAVIGGFLPVLQSLVPARPERKSWTGPPAPAALKRSAGEQNSWYSNHLQRMSSSSTIGGYDDQSKN